MKITFIILIITFFSISRSTIEHPIHLSVINMEYDENKEEFEMLIRVFTDDFEAIINKELKTSIKLVNNNTKENYIYIDKFLKKHIKVYFNNKYISGKMKIFKIEDDVEKNTTEVIYKFKHKIPKKVNIINSLFLGYFRDQKNLFIFTCGKTQEAFKFDRKKTEFEFKI